MTKKLAGAAKGTALWVSSVSNEVGQVLISVLTAQEGPGLDQMVSDLIRRYSEAGVAPPLLLYVDLWLLQGGGRGDQAEDQVQRVAGPRHPAGHLALPSAARGWMHDRRPLPVPHLHGQSLRLPL